jgi:tRNA uridine 5-carboxymethylaminomethyl modification enzyme
MERVSFKKEMIEKITDFVKKESVHPEDVNPYLENVNSKPLTQKVKISGLILRPEVSFNGLIRHIPSLNHFIRSLGSNIDEIIEEAEILIKYDNYISKEQDIADKLSNLEHIKLRDDFDYRSLKSLSYEAREKLSKIRPRSIGQASRISGVSPADISVLLVYLGR